MKEAQTRKLRDGYWIGYSIQRVMGEREFFIAGTSIRWDSVRDKGRRTLADLISGKSLPGEKKTDNQIVRQAAKDALTGKEHRSRRVSKELAILVEFRSSPVAAPADFAMLNLSLPFDLKQHPLIWLGSARDEESVTLLQELYRTSPSDGVREDLISSIAMHQGSQRVLSFLRQVAESKAPDRLRAVAVLGLGSQGSEDAIPVLLEMCQRDPSRAVREAALNGLVEIESPAARKAILGLLKNGKDRQLREAALYLLTEDATQEEIAGIQELIMSDPDRQIQEAALYAIAERKDGVPILVRAARTHKDRAVREAALYALAEDGSPDAVEALKQVALADPDARLQESALYALVDLEDDAGVQRLVEIARTHPSKEMRLRAVRVLGESDSPRARDELLRLLEE